MKGLKVATTDEMTQEELNRTHELLTKIWAVDLMLGILEKLDSIGLSLTQGIMTLQRLKSPAFVYMVTEVCNQSAVLVPFKETNNIKALMEIMQKVVDELIPGIPKNVDIELVAPNHFDKSQNEDSGEN